MLGLFKKESKEDLQNKRADELLTVLSKTFEVGIKTKEFSHLEKVQIANSFRRKLSEILESEKSEAFERSVNENQKANEIKEAISYLE